MKASCSLTALLEAVDDLLGPEPACDHRDKDGERHLPWPAFPTLTLSTGKGKLTVMGTFYGVTLEVVVPAKVRVQGAVDLRSSAFQHLLQGLLHGEGKDHLDLISQDDRLLLATGPTVASILKSTRLSAEVEPIDAPSRALPASEVYAAIRRTLFAVGTDNKLDPAFRALHFSQAGQSLTAIATDSKVLVRSKGEAFGSQANAFPRIGLPRDSAELLARMLRHHTEVLVDLRISPTYCSWSLPSGTRLTSRLVTDPCPDILAAVPERTNFRFVQVEQFRNVCEMLAAAGNPSAVLQFEGDEVKVTGSNSLEAPVATALPLRTVPFPPWRGKFGTLYLCEIFDHVTSADGQAVEMSMGDNLSAPLVVRDAHLLAVLMPIASTDSDYRT